MFDKAAKCPIISLYLAYGSLWFRNVVASNFTKDWEDVKNGICK
jgi:hypothetical protein